MIFSKYDLRRYFRIFFTLNVFVNKISIFVLPNDNFHSTVVQFVKDRK